MKNIEIIERDKIVKKKKKMGEAMLEGFKALQAKYSFIGSVRTIGLLGAIELVKSRETGELFETLLSPTFVQETMKRGLILRTGTYDQDTIVFSPPLILSKAELNEMLRILDETFEHVRKTIVEKEG